MTTAPTPSPTPPSAHSASGSKLDHPAFAAVKERFPGARFRGTEFRGQSTLIVEPAEHSDGGPHEVMRFLRDDPRTSFNFLSDVFGIDYLNYPAAGPASPASLGRFAVVYNLISFARDDRFFVKVHLNPSLPTDGIVEDPALMLDSVCDLWAGAEWPEREVFDMFGIRFRNHPDLRRILTWETYPAHPLRKDYALRGRGERDFYKVVDRTSA